MSIGLRKNDRNVIPRWRDSAIAATTGELKSLNERLPLPDLVSDELADRIDDWILHRTSAFASDLVATARVLDVKDNAHVVEAAHYILSSTQGDPNPVRDLALAVLGITGADADAKLTEKDDVPDIKYFSRNRIRYMKKRLKEDPRNGLAWVDMARHYAMLGALKHAERAMTIGLKLAPKNRFVLRSAARLFIHLDDGEQAYDLLRKNAATASDPWLRAAEIATAGVIEKTPRKLSATKRILRGSNINPTHVSELASAVATFELKNGSVKSARRLFNLGLQRATENSVAQAEWAARTKKVNGISLGPKHFRLPRTFEAKAIGHLEDLDSRKCVQECANWLADEPFSSRPVELSTVISIIGLEDYNYAAEVARRGLVSNPAHFVLRNNLSVALAEGGRIEEAITEFGKNKKLTLDDWQKTTSLATKGLLAFRDRKYKEGRFLYREAANVARRNADVDSEAMVLIHWAREEFMAHDFTWSDRIAKQANKAAGIQPGPVLELARSRFRNLKARNDAEEKTNKPCGLGRVVGGEV